MTLLRLRTLAIFLSAPLLSFGAAQADDDHGHHDDDCGAPGTTLPLALMPVSSLSFPPTGPTYPEGTAVVGDRVITSGPANFGTANNGSPSQLTVFDSETGELLGEVPLVGEDLSQEHALSELASDKKYLFAPSTQLGVLRWKLTGDLPSHQEQVSTPFCSVTGVFPCHTASSACPATVRPGLPPLPNGITVDDEGLVYVTDSLQGIVWRVSPSTSGPVAPEVLFCDPRLQGSGSEGLSLFGANGIAIDGDDLYVSVTFGPFDAMGPTAVIYRMDKEHPTDLQEVIRFSGVEVAPGVVVPPLLDGLRLHPETGHLFAVLGGHNAVAEIDISGPVGTLLAEFTGTDAALPMINPSTLAFDADGERAYISNHAITRCLPGDPNPGCLGYDGAELFGVIEMCTGD